MTADLRAYQRETLTSGARETGVYADLLHFCAVSRDTDALRALEPELSAHEQCLCRLLLGAPPEPLAEVLGGSPDPWVRYTLVKALLRVNALETAWNVMERGLALGDGGVAVINLLARWLARKGAPEPARELAFVSLGLAPDQRDMTALAEGAEAPETAPFPLYLDVLPRFVPVTFYVPVFNAEAYMARAIEGVLAQCYPLDAVVVVDDGSTDASMEIAAGYPLEMAVHSENRGLAAARNTAFTCAESPLVAACDADAFPEPGYMKYIMMEWENSVPAVAGIGGRLVELYRETPADLWRCLHLPQDPGLARLHPPRFLFGSNTVFRRDAVLDAGGYDTRFRTNSEDVELCERLEAAGHTFTATPHARACHMRRDTPASVLRAHWGWAFEHRRRHGMLLSLEVLAGELPSLMDTGMDILAGDMAAGQHTAAYVDFLFPIHQCIHNLAYAVTQGWLSDSALRTAQQGLLESVRPFDARFGGALFEKVRADTAPLLAAAPAGEMPAAVAREVAAFQERMAGFCARMQPDTYAALANG